MKESSRNVIAFIGVGSNQEDPVFQCRRALEHIAAADSLEILRKSSLYRTEPVGVKGQQWFVNAVIEIRTALHSHDLLNVMLDIENAMGRVRKVRWGPRIIDLDILLYGHEMVNNGDLVIPHPELHRRRFVLEPLAEIASYVIHPMFGVSIRGLLERLDDPRVVEPLKGVSF